MRPSSAIVAVLLCASLQAAAPAAPPPASDAPRRIPAAEQVQVNLVLIDVVVRDGKGNLVRGLTSDAFELLVDRLPIEPAAIESFEAICPAQPEAASAATAEASGAPPAAPPESAPEAASPRHIVVIFDFSHLSLSGRRQSLQSARSYFSNRLQPGDRVMLLAYKKGMHLLQDFTSSPSLLMARVDELLPDTASLEGEVLEEGSKMTDVSRRPCDGGNLAAVGDSLESSCLGRRAMAHSYAVEEEGRTRRALRSIEDLMPALASLRGRKALVIFSDVLRDEPGIQYLALARTSPLSLGVDVKEDILRLTREANAAGVAIYSVHASGLDDASQVMFAHSPGDVQETTERRDPVLATAARTGLDAALSLQATLATETGGRAVQRTNDLASVLDVVRQDFSCHYLIGYHHAGRGDNQRHSLIVRMRPGPDGRPRRYEVRHRPYYIDYAPAERRNRLVRSALDVPRLHSAVPVGLEAFALTPGSKGRRLLLKATVPLASLSLLPSSDGRLDGRVRVTGEVLGPSGVMCA